jgi:hypothetical protein
MPTWAPSRSDRVRKRLTLAWKATLMEWLVIQGVEQTLRPRQSELRDGYLVKLRARQAR